MCTYVNICAHLHAFNYKRTLVHCVNSTAPYTMCSYPPHTPDAESQMMSPCIISLGVDGLSFVKERPHKSLAGVPAYSSLHPHTHRHTDTLRRGASIAGGSSLTYEPQPSLQLPEGHCHAAADERIPQGHCRTAAEERRCSHVKSSPLTAASHARPWRPKRRTSGRHFDERNALPEY